MYPHTSAHAANAEFVAAFVQAIATLTANNNVNHPQKSSTLAGKAHHTTGANNFCADMQMDWEIDNFPPKQNSQWNPLSYEPQFSAQRQNPSFDFYPRECPVEAAAVPSSFLEKQHQHQFYLPVGGAPRHEYSRDNGCDERLHPHNPMATTTNNATTTTSALLTSYASHPQSFVQPQRNGYTDNNQNSDTGAFPSISQLLHDYHTNECQPPNHFASPLPHQQKVLSSNQTTVPTALPQQSNQQQMSNACSVRSPLTVGACERNGGCCIACGDVNSTGEFLRLFRPDDGPDLTLAVVRDGARVNLRIPRKYFANTRYLRVFLKPGMPLKPLTFSTDDVCRRHMLNKCGSGSSCKFLHICTQVWGPLAKGDASPLVYSLQAPSAAFLKSTNRPCRGSQNTQRSEVEPAASIW